MPFLPKTQKEKLAIIQTIFTIIGIIIGILYFIWPIDLIPDIFPIIGWTDDIGFFILSMMISNWMGKHIAST